MTAKNPHTGQPYRGWKSTKLHLSLITMGVLTLAYAMTGWNAHYFDAFAMGLLGASMIYTGGNVAEKFRRAPPAPSDYSIQVGYAPDPSPPMAAPPTPPAGPGTVARRDR
jgi:hypothetical protein